MYWWLNRGDEYWWLGEYKQVDGGWWWCMSGGVEW